MPAIPVIERLFGWASQTTWQAAVLALLILLAQFLLRRRLSPGWRYGLWLLLVARLLMPVTPRSALSIFNLAGWSLPAAAPSAAPPAAPVRPDTPGVAAAPITGPPVLATRHPETAPPLRPAQKEITAVAVQAMSRGVLNSPLAKHTNWKLVAALGWLAGALLLGLRFGVLNWLFYRHLRRASPISDSTAMDLLEECAGEMGVAQRPWLLEMAEVEAPAVYGFWRHWLLLPKGLRHELSPEELRYVFLHELAHVKRRDPELNWLVALLQCFHWPNPVLWFAFNRMRADRELATDDLALAHSRQRDRGAYGETILKVLEQLSGRRALPGLVGIGETKAQIKERIRAIARGRSAPRWGWAALGATAVLAGIALTSAREQQQGVDLLKKYPTTLTTGDTAPENARPWRFTPDDIFQVSKFSLEIGKQLRVETGAADLGIGHCADGAVWAVVLPRAEGTLTSPVAKSPESIANIWLRFHPAQIDRLFPPETVSGPGQPGLEGKIRAVADAKFHSSWHAGNSAMIPEPKDMTVDVDTKDGPRRFFAVDTAAGTAQHWANFAKRTAASQPRAAYVPEVDPQRARVVSVSPADGAENVDCVEPLRIRFDRPMNPYALKLEWQAGGFQLRGAVSVSADGTEFTLPVRWTPGQEQKLVLNRDTDREMWVAMGSRPESKPKRSEPRGGFMDAKLVAANEFRWSFSTKPVLVQPGGARPRLVSASPPSGATTPVLALVQLTFDQPMRPPDITFPYQEQRPFTQGPSLIPSFDYDPATYRFSVPALLRPEDDVRLTLQGFYGADGQPCEPIVLHYQTGSQGLDSRYREKARAAAKDPQLKQLLTSMKEARARLNSGVETVQTIRLGMAKDAFNSIDAQTATFKWQGAEVYGDITGPMQMTRAFILGSDGQTCWLYSVSDKGEKRLEQTPAASTEVETLVADPFELAHRSVDEALAGRTLVLGSKAVLEGHECYRVEDWEVSQEGMAWASQTQWWIDARTFLLRQIVQFYSGGGQVVRFDYQELNQPLPANAFQPPSVPRNTAEPLFFTKAPGPGEQRFLKIVDGSNGRMSGRLGWHGPGGTTSSGLN